MLQRASIGTRESPQSLAQVCLGRWVKPTSSRIRSMVGSEGACSQLASRRALVPRTEKFWLQRATTCQRDPAASSGRARSQWDGPIGGSRASESRRCWGRGPHGTGLHSGSAGPLSPGANRPVRSQAASSDIAKRCATSPSSATAHQRTGPNWPIVPPLPNRNWPSLPNRSGTVI